MPDSKLNEYIKQSLQAGMSRETIKTNLLANGWQEQEIENTLQFLEAGNTNISANKSKKKKILKGISLVVSIVALVVYFFPAVAGRFSSDIAPIDDSDLRLDVVRIPDVENAYFDLIKIEKVIYSPKDQQTKISDIANGKNWDERFVNELLSRNKDTLQYFKDAAHKPRFQDPIPADPQNISPDAPLPPLNSWRNAARLSSIQAQYLVRQDRDKEAIEEALNSIYVGQELTNSQGSIIQYLVGLAIKRIGLTTLQSVISLSNLDNTELKRYAEKLNDFYDTKGGLISALRAEYKFLNSALDLIIVGMAQEKGTIEVSPAAEELIKSGNISGVKLNFYYFQPNKTKLLIAKYMREKINTLHKSCHEITIIDTTTKDSQRPSIARLYFTENAIGNILTSATKAAFNNTAAQPCDTNALIAATRAMIGIKAFKNDTGSYPTSLNELVPQYLSSIPIDPYDSTSLKYSLEKKIIYSIGSDKQDSGGSTGDDWSKMPDLTFKITF